MARPASRTDEYILYLHDQKWPISFFKDYSTTQKSVKKVMPSKPSVGSDIQDKTVEKHDMPSKNLEIM